MTRTVYPAVPARVDYELTRIGLSVAEPLRALRTWVETHLDDVGSLTRGASVDGYCRRD